MAQTVLGIDYGNRCMGLAVGQSVTRTARPVAVLSWDVPEQAGHWQLLLREIAAWQPDIILVGIPLDADMQRQWTTDAAEAFARALQQRAAFPVRGISEGFSTRAARERVRDWENGGNSQKILEKWRGRHDAVAATILVEAYFANPLSVWEITERE